MKRSSRTPPSGLVRTLYCAPSSAILLTSLERMLLEERLRVRPVRLDLAHVADVEHADLRPHRDMLGADARVLHRHLPPGERHEPRPGGSMTIVQRRPLQRLGARGHRGRTLAALSDVLFGLHCRVMRAGMRGVVGVLVVLATAAVGVPVASAGRYDVVSCGAPGARRHQPRVASRGRSRRSDPPTPDDRVLRRSSRTSARIAAAVGAAPHPAALRAGSWAPAANWVFNAPAGTGITRLETWRFGVRHGCAPTIPTRSRQATLAGLRPRRDANVRSARGVRRDVHAAARARSAARSAATPASATPRKPSIDGQRHEDLLRRVSCETPAAARATTTTARTRPVATSRSSGARVTHHGHRPPRCSTSAGRCSAAAGASQATPSPSTPRTARGSARLDSTSAGRHQPRQRAPATTTCRVPAAGARTAALSSCRHGTPTARTRRAHRGRGRRRQRAAPCSARSDRRHAADRHPRARPRQEDRALA